MYQSPFTLAGISSESIDKKALQLARRKLLAELELGGQPSLLLHGKEFTKQNINALFDELLDEPQFQLHLAIFHNKSLLHFLETAEVQTGEPLLFPALNNQTSAGFSGMAGEAIRALIQKILKGAGLAEQYLMAHELVETLSPLDRDAALQPAYRYYTLRSSTLEKTLADEKSGRPIDLNDAIDWISKDRISLLNALGSDLSDVRYQIARDLNNLAVALETNNKIPEAFAVIQRASGIATTESLMALIQENLVLYRRKAQQEAGAINEFGGATDNRQRRKSPVNFYVVFGLVIFFLVSMSVFVRLSNKRDPGSRESATREAGYKMDAVQKHNEIAYQKLKQALARSVYTGNSSGTREDISIQLPGDHEEDGFAQVWSSLMIRAGDMLNDTTGAAQLLVSNGLPAMDLFVLINVDNRYFGSIYLKPGQTKAYRYKGLYQADFNFYIGSKWDSIAQIGLDVPPVGNAKAKAFNLKGAFLDVPANSTDYLNPDYGVFARAEMEGRKPFRDTAVVVWGKEGKVEFQLGLDERDF